VRKIRLRFKLFSLAIIFVVALISFNYLKVKASSIKLVAKKDDSAEEVKKCYAQLAAIAIANEDEKSINNLTLDKHCTFEDGQIIDLKKIDFNYLKDNPIIYWNLNQKEADIDSIGRYDLESGSAVSLSEF